jgi:cyclopropane-fatty-acyl-phospholipid synthase
VLCEDYRDLHGSYDKLVSIEMIEAVGHEFYRDYFQKCSSLLTPGGLMAIQAITIPDQRYEISKNSVDFIKRYIFPGGCLPSVEVISRHIARDTDMQITHLRDITQDYAETLALWRERFNAALPEVRAQGFDQAFERMWEFYLCYCEGGFRERIIGTVQLTFAKPAYRISRAP